MSSPILIAGFGPIPDIKENLGIQMLDLLPSEIDSHPIEKLTIPFTWDRAGKTAKTLLEQWRTSGSYPAAMLIFCAKPKPHFTLEQFAYNYAAGTDHCNGVRNQKVQPGSKLTRIATPIDLGSIVNKLSGTSEILPKISTNPGRFISNFVYFTLLCGIARPLPILMMQLPSSIPLKSVSPIVLQVVQNLPKIPLLATDQTGQ
jgi:pyrrolidone-carboxylate peptidase